MHDIDMKEMCRKMDFLIIFSGHIILANSYGSKLCFIINLYLYTHL